MNKLPLFIAALVCWTMITSCNRPQQKETLKDDVVWKATISYCLNKEGVEIGSDLERCDIYNFKVLEQTGSYRKLIKLFYDSAISKTYPCYEPDISSNMAPMDSVMSRKEIEKRLICLALSVKDDSGKTKDIKINYDENSIIGLDINHEYMFNVRTCSLQSSITDVDLLQKALTQYDDTYSPDDTNITVSMVAIKFSNRASYRLGTGQEVLKPEITWGRDRILRIRKSFINSPTMRVNANDSSGRWICTLNGIKANLGYGTTTPIKTTFNKKLVEWIWDAARNGSVPAYYYVGEDKIGEQIPAKEMKNFGNKDPEIIHDTFYFPGKPYMSHHKLGPDYLTGLELREEISFHQSTFSFESKITYAGVLVICVNKNTGRAIPNASKTLYWVKLN